MTRIAVFLVAVVLLALGPPATVDSAGPATIGARSMSAVPVHPDAAEKLRCRLDDVMGPRAARFLSGRDDQDSAGAARKAGGGIDGGGNECRDAAFHVGCATAVDAALGRIGGEGVHGPGAGAEWHDINMAGEA